MGKIAIIGAILTVVLMFVFTKIDPNLNGNGGNDSNIVSVIKEYVTCTISGEINRPGKYVLNNNSTLLDLITNAGGITANADDLAYNPSLLLEDNGEYYIAKKSATPDTCVMETIKKVNINLASKEELMTVNGIGATIAQAIVNYRNENGDFTCLEQLKEVTGIGNSTFEKIKDYLTLY